MKHDIPRIVLRNKEQIGEVGKSHFFIVDEADCTTDMPIRFDKEGNLDGLYHLMHAEKVFFMGSTMSEAQKLVLQSTFKIDPNHILKTLPTFY